MKLHRSLSILVLLLMLAGATLVAAAPEDPTVTGPVSGSAGDYMTYSVSNPAGNPLSIISSTGIWVRSIVVMDPGTTCSLDDGGTEDTVTCDGDFKVTISSDLGQQLLLRIYTATLTVGLSGEHRLPEESLVHIYNGLVPAVQSVNPFNPNPPATTNTLAGEYTSYRLAALNFSSNITRTFDITMTVPLDVLMVKSPRNCAQPTPGTYRCLFTAGPQDWFTAGFEVRWLAQGVKPLTAVGTIDGVEVGRDTRLGNVIFVTKNQRYIPIARR